MRQDHVSYFKFSDATPMDGGSGGYLRENVAQQKNKREETK